MARPQSSYEKTKIRECVISRDTTDKIELFIYPRTLTQNRTYARNDHLGTYYGNKNVNTSRSTV